MGFSGIEKVDVLEHNYLIEKYNKLDEVYRADSKLLSILLKTIGEEQFDIIVKDIEENGINKVLREANRLDALVSLLETLSDYDIGLLGGYADCSVDWWQDYVKEEVSRCNDFWRDQVKCLTEASKTA